MAVDPAVVTATVAELRGQSQDRIDTQRTDVEALLTKAFTEAGETLDVSMITSIEGSLSEKSAKLVEMNSRLTGIEQISAERQAMIATSDRILNGNVEQPEEDDAPRYQARAPRFSDTFMNHINQNDIRAESGFKHEFADVDPRQWMAATVTTSAGWDPEVIRQPGAVPAISRPIQLLDVLPQAPTNQHGLSYMMQTTRTATAVVEKAEGAASGEAVFEWTERTEAIREIPAHVPVTEVQLEDEPQIRQILDNDLALMVRQRADGQILSGTGTAPNVRGLLITRNAETVGDFDWAVTASKRSDQIGDLRKAKSRRMVIGRCMPNVYLCHPYIFDEIALKDTAGSGYYLGSPANDFVERLWGLPVVITDHLSDVDASGTIGAVVMDTSYVTVWMRRGIHTEIGYNNDDFTKRLLTIRAGMRLGVQVKRPMAIATLTMP